MKVSDSTTTPMLFMSSLSSPVLLKKNKKAFKFNRRLNTRVINISKTSSPVAVPVNNYQVNEREIIPMWTHTRPTPLNSMVTFINTNPIPINTLSPSASTSSSVIQPQQNAPVYPSYKPFTTPRVTTTLIPLNVCPTEYCQTVKPTSTPLVKIIENHQEKNIYEHKSNDTIITHLIGDWIIRESSKPFQRKENDRPTLIERLTNQEKKDTSNESIISRQSSPLNVNQWTINDVCSFFERVLGKNSYAPIIQEHLIDGAALLLLQDEHLTSIFHMQLGPRIKLLDRIHKLQKGDLSAM